jgi:two-component system, OmpR family, KDP operon response regulator KdpE
MSVMLDLGRPGIDDVAVIRRLRGWTRVPIIVLRVRASNATRPRLTPAPGTSFATLAALDWTAVARATLQRILT